LDSFYSGGYGLCEIIPLKIKNLTDINETKITKLPDVIFKTGVEILTYFL